MVFEEKLQANYNCANLYSKVQLFMGIDKALQRWTREEIGLFCLVHCVKNRKNRFCSAVCNSSSSHLRPLEAWWQAVSRAAVLLLGSNGGWGVYIPPWGILNFSRPSSLYSVSKQANILYTVHNTLYCTLVEVLKADLQEMAEHLKKDFLNLNIFEFVLHLLADKIPERFFEISVPYCKVL